MVDYRYEEWNNSSLVSYYRVYDDSGTIKWTDGNETRLATDDEMVLYTSVNQPSRADNIQKARDLIANMSATSATRKALTALADAVESLD